MELAEILGGGRGTIGAMREAAAETADDGITNAERKVFVQHLPKTATQEEVAKHMRCPATRVQILRSRYEQGPIGACVCEYESAEEAQRAVRELNNQVFKGNKLYIREVAPGTKYTAPAEDWAVRPAQSSGQRTPTGRWNVGLFSCFSHLPTCMLGTVGWLFAPILGYLKARAMAGAGLRSLWWGVLLLCGIPLAFWGFVIWALCLTPPDELSRLWILCIMPPVVGIGMFRIYRRYRTELRSHYDIEASDGCGDRCVVLLCWPCSAMQEYRHVVGYQESRRGQAQPASVAAPVHQVATGPDTAAVPQIFTK